jgi:hypothetical protein
VNQNRQNSHLTHKANIGVGRHGWLRLTPAYSVRLVRERMEHLPTDSIVTDPFSGSGTTALAAAEHGCLGQATDVNPFLVWLGNAKLRNYGLSSINETRRELEGVVEQARKRVIDAEKLWQPNLFNIERWWSPSSLAVLKAVRATIDDHGLPTEAHDLLSIALCRTVIGTSNASFNHQSMSFKAATSSTSDGALFSQDELQVSLQRFIKEANSILDSALIPLPGTGTVVNGDSRESNTTSLSKCDFLLTSPPYVNRMSYIRELRPYMYWLRFLDKASDAGELDWQAIGGTWGIATSRLNEWAPDKIDLPISQELSNICKLIQQDGEKNGPILANYVEKYFYDMFKHIKSAFSSIKSGGHATYIIGNSTFYKHVVPAQEWYATMMREVGFSDVTITTIRKRNSNQALYEYDVSGSCP